MTVFDAIAGNDAIKEYLTRMVKNKALGSSLLFSGPEGIGKSLFANALATLILGQENHPDLHIYRPEGKIGMHSIHSMRKFSEDVYMAPYTGKWKVFIIHDAERMLSYSANALLKTFEEPSKDTTIILLSSHPEMLLPTILSRCRVIRFQSLDENAIANLLETTKQLNHEDAMRIASMSQGSMSHAVRLIEQGGDELRKKVLFILSRGKFATYKELSSAVDEIYERVEESKKQIEELIRQELVQVPQENLSSIQKEGIEKEIDGAVTMRMMHDAQGLFDVILGWHRDMHLMQVGGDRRFLLHRDSENEIEQSLQRGELIPLETVQGAIRKAKISLERSTSLNLCLETLFLQLNLI